jgi:hypothetical protein
MERGASAEEAAAAAGIGAYDRVLRGGLGQRTPREWRAMLDDVIALERRARCGIDLDAADFAALALKWSRRSAARAR